MAQLLTLVVSHDEQFRKQAERLLRSCPVPIGVLDEGSQRTATAPDVVMVDIRNDPTAGMASLERVRGAAQAAVERRHLLAEDIPAIVARAGAQWDLFQAWFGGTD